MVSQSKSIFHLRSPVFVVMGGFRRALSSLDDISWLHLYGSAVQLRLNMTWNASGSFVLSSGWLHTYNLSYRSGMCNIDNLEVIIGSRGSKFTQ